MSTNCIDVNDILKQLGNDHVYLKMDIEGAEYDVLTSILNHKRSIVGMAIEFHDMTTDPCNLQQIERILEFYYVSHIHVNNVSELNIHGIPNVVEISFVRKDLVPAPQFFSGTTYRLPIDSPCVLSRPDYSIQFTKN